MRARHVGVREEREPGLCILPGAGSCTFPSVAWCGLAVGHHRGTQVRLPWSELESARLQAGPGAAGGGESEEQPLRACGTPLRQAALSARPGWGPDMSTDGTDPEWVSPEPGIPEVALGARVVSPALPGVRRAGRRAWHSWSHKVIRTPKTMGGGRGTGQGTPCWAGRRQGLTPSGDWGGCSWGRGQPGHPKSTVCLTVLKIFIVMNDTYHTTCHFHHF